MTKIAFRDVTKAYPGARRPVVDGVTFDVPEGVICMLLGTSGAGKTTLLRMVNRLVEPTSGAILIDGRDVLAGDPIALRRRIGYVIQQVGLFPHMTVAENVRLTGEVAGRPRDEMARRADELLTLVGLEPAEYRTRYPRQLSGGEQQRVGIARALANSPGILLMDEPFGALDAITRSRMQAELLRIQRGVRTTIVFVTHDVDEAFRLGSLIAIMSEGRLVQAGTPVELLTRPAGDFVRRLIGADAILRQLEYLPVSVALERPTGPPPPADGRIAAGPPAARLRAGATLLDALLALLETGAPALAVAADGAADPVGYVTLPGLAREIAALREAGRPAGR
ncbi:MAG TPA: ATP-binding cassette domain-containing protein [bacterium]|nr:ATP-binding cassette domain-containing protein [bacterium]